VKRTTHLTVEVTEKPQVIKAVGAEEDGERPKRAQKPSTKKAKPAKA
jgi:hypothetical protein